MWSVIIVLYLGAVKYTVFSSPPSPVDVVFSSVNLRNVLQWHPGNDTAPNTHFTVQYAIYGDTAEGSGGRRMHWRAVWQCRDTVRSWCDLTNETWDLEQAYYARVRTVGKRGASKWAVTQTRFDPKSDTSFGPPLVSVAMEENSAIIGLKGPMRHQLDSHTPEVPMATLYPQMTYELSVHNARRNQTRHFPMASGLYKYRLMEYDTEYCFSAKTRFFSMPVPCQPSAWHCITTPQDPVIGQLHRVVVGIVVPTVCICMLAVAGYLLCRSLRGEGQKKPHILELTKFHCPPLTFSPEVTKFILITPHSSISSKPPPVTSDPTCPKPQLPAPVLLAHFPSYALQNPGMLPEPEAPWENESVHYGFVEQQGEEGENVWKSDGGGDGDHSDGREDGARDSCERNESGGENDHSATADASQANPYLPQKRQHTHTPTHTQAETFTFVQAHTWSQVQTLLLTQTQASRNALQGRVEGEMEEEKEDRACSGLRINKDPHTGLFHIPLLPQTVKGRRDGVMDGRVEEGKDREEAPLLSPYASQHVEDTPTSHTGQWDYLSDNYAVLGLATEQEMEEEEEEEEDETNCVNWDPETRKLVLPQTETERKREGGMGREEEEERELRLESVLVGQESEEEAETERGMERGRETRWEADEILTNWNLVIPMDQ
ncbi:interleukin-20 receptor subunit alpha [Centroberyx gerrardi]